MELVIGLRLHRLCSVFASKVLSNNPRDITSDTAGAVWELAIRLRCSSSFWDTRTIRLAPEDCGLRQYAKGGSTWNSHG